MVSISPGQRLGSMLEPDARRRNMLEFLSTWAASSHLICSSSKTAGVSIEQRTAQLGFAACMPSLFTRNPAGDRKSTRLNSSHSQISYAVFCLKKKKTCTYKREKGNPSPGSN